MVEITEPHPSSYRDPSGFVFEKDGIVYRQVNDVFKENFDFFISSGCYDHLVNKGLLVSHRIIHNNLTGHSDWYTTLLPEKINFISYPYEWSFDMLKDAALLTLQLVKEVIGYGLILKDATPYNIQWHNGQLIFIDTLSFEKYDEAQPWIAYRQFCESFLAPLLIMYYSKRELTELLLSYSDGISLSVIKALLPFKSRFSIHTLLHIHLHASASTAKKAKNVGIQFSKQKLLNIINSLETLIKQLKLSKQKTTWSNYYEEAATRNNYLEQKKKIISEWVDGLSDVKLVADLGANEGEFSQLIASKNIKIIVADFDAACINKLYNQIKLKGEKNIQPMVLDLSRPTPAIGVNNKERQSFMERSHFDLVMGLALIHHLCIGKNIPFEKVATFFKQICKYLIIEFVPKDDEKVQVMLSNKKDIYCNYTENNFIQEFGKHFNIIKKQIVGNTNRVLFLMQKLDN